LRRILSVLTAAALMTAMLVVLQGPAMAQSLDFDNNDFFDNGFFGFDNNADNDFFDDNGFGGFDINQETDETGDVDLSVGIGNGGNNSNQTAAPLQFGNTGNLQNAQGFSQFGSSADDIDFEGGSFDFSPRQGIGSNQGVFQSAVSD
jgi:hypothetical protein